MKKTIVALMCIVSLVIMTACGGGSPVDKALKKIDTAIEKLEKANKKGNKMSQEELDQIGKDLSEPLQVLNDALEKNEIGGITKLKIIGKVSKLSILAINAGLQNLDLGDLTKEAKKATPEKNE
ncbi:hypothetical protein NXY11_10145 [Parabacteroides faecis]|uniref:hypothetical protein n=1 Tax=Parabacteroides faecis TaxID=1217282 RepID=UPI0021643E0D|nr:hypothetical protein [Parabacteroides faecis]MCS2892836.1 hypothetical protein [Parabacteroides faecis]UVQ48555.1 hypothetical protein NXY11_10145 [Parabacteroides faecis]